MAAKNTTQVDNSLTGSVLGMLTGGFLVWTFMPPVKYRAKISLIAAVGGAIIGYKIGKKIKSTYKEK